MEQLTERAIKMTVKNGFTELFWQAMHNNPDKSQTQVYEELEIEYLNYFGRRRYSNYNSFRRRRDK